MHADIKGALDQLNKFYTCFEHNGKSMTKAEVKAVLEYGLRQGYKTTDEFSDNEVDLAIKNIAAYRQLSSNLSNQEDWQVLNLNIRDI